MAFETGVPVTLDGLLQDIVTFAVANAGFTEMTKITTGLPAGNTTDMYILEKNGIYWWFLGMQRTDADFGTYGEIDCRMMLTLPTVSNMETEADGTYRKSRYALLNRPSGPYTNSFLYSATGDSVSLVLEITPGVFTHMSFGTVNKFGTWTGGEFLTGESIYMYNAYSVANGFQASWNSVITNYGSMAFDNGYNSGYYVNGLFSYVYHPVNSYGDNRDFAMIRGGAVSAGVPDYNQRARFQGCYYDGSSGDSLIQPLMYRSPNSFNQRAGLFPTYLMLYDEVSQRWLLAGHVEGVRHLRIDLLTPKETIEVEWDIYPHYQKTGDQMVAPISGPFGLAYRKVT
jgi:hypothetical protein